MTTTVGVQTCYKTGALFARSPHLGDEFNLLGEYWWPLF
eukprot:CAMPEP_0171092328 /NCGR_PEP_ID=MMETSP0766_2-20121228/35627_1 /TAXON_ID=439317 /ORGANISM="Gambierdiscus australes, Strain CAWD 149" /LENGTH=38 /DNA_ID= /DNA_START= /DNA_END= /DNA_ORIENTATION=